MYLCCVVRFTQWCIDMCGSNNTIIRKRERINAASAADRKKMVQVLTDIWHAAKGVKKNFLKFLSKQEDELEGYIHEIEAMAEEKKVELTTELLDEVYSQLQEALHATFQADNADFKERATAFEAEFTSDFAEVRVDEELLA
eukprot:SAG11_NODE_282_length_11247_cov_11.050323_8_plen_142_part_00